MFGGKYCYVQLMLELRQALLIALPALGDLFLELLDKFLGFLVLLH